MAWTFILTDHNSVPVGEILNAYDRQVALPLNKLDTMSFRVRVDNPQADSLLSTAGNIKAYRDGQLVFHGPVISAEETGDSNGASVAVNAVGAGWVLSKRFTGKTPDEQYISINGRISIMREIIRVANVENETGIDTTVVNVPGTLDSFASYVPGPYRPISDVITELSASFNGFDWRILPLENYDYTSGTVVSPKIGQFYGDNVIGTPQPNAVFEWGKGTRANMASYTRTVSRDTQANKVYHFTSNGPDAPGFPTVSAIDTSSISDWRLLEDLAQADLTNPTLRQQLVDEHVRVRRYPRQVIQFTPHIDPQRTGRLPQYGIDYVVGDTVRARAVYGTSVRFDADMRVWGVSFTIDNNGLERAALTLAEE